MIDRSTNSKQQLTTRSVTGGAARIVNSEAIERRPVLCNDDDARSVNADGAAAVSTKRLRISDVMKDAAILRRVGAEDIELERAQRQTIIVRSR